MRVVEAEMSGGLGTVRSLETRGRMPGNWQTLQRPSQTD